MFWVCTCSLDTCAHRPLSPDRRLKSMVGGRWSSVGTKPATLKALNRRPEGGGDWCLVASARAVLRQRFGRYVKVHLKNR